MSQSRDLQKSWKSGSISDQPNRYTGSVVLLMTSPIFCVAAICVLKGYIFYMYAPTKSLRVKKMFNPESSHHFSTRREAYLRPTHDSCDVVTFISFLHPKMFNVVVIYFVGGYPLDIEISVGLWSQ